MPSYDAPPTPERRSAADLQKILDSLIGTSGFVLAGDLPDVLLAYEDKHDITILDPSEYEGLRALCGAHAEMELGASELFQFLSSAHWMIQKPAPVPSGSPSKSSSAAHLPSDSVDQSTPTQHRKKTHRRQSDRIRSPSDSSGTSSSSEDDTMHRNRLTRQISEPPGGTAFPASSSAVQPIAKAIHPKRKKTLSDPSRLNSPLAMRASRNGGAPPSAFGGFARPSPASRRRRGSQSDNEDRSPEYGSRLDRSSSSQSIRVTSPTWSTHGGGSIPTSPTSPGVDHTSFHARAKSPEDMSYEESQAEMQVDEAEGDDEDDGGEEVEETDDIVGQDMVSMGGEALNPRLSRISTESSTSLRTSHDKLQALQKQNTELSRKLKESERQLALLGADNDRMVLDLERQLEEARHELAQKRKDDKELRGHELKQNIQISGLEADLANVQRTLEQSKEHRANMQKMYDSQCDETQRLRDLLLDRDNEIRQLEESAADHEADEAKFSREMQALEAEVKRLESELATARRAESVLETQKQENLQLKETIDRMRFDLEEAKNNAANAGKGHGRTATSNSSVEGTLSRNLGDEISRRLQDVQPVVDEEEEGEGDSYVETVVTTQRTRKVGSRKPSNTNPQGSGSASVPTIHVDEEVREYADAGTITDAVRILPLLEEKSAEEQAEAGPSTTSSPQIPHENPPAYTAKPDPVNEQEVLDRHHPRKHGQDIDADDEYEALVQATGVRCNVLEEELKLRRAERTKRGTVSDRASDRYKVPKSLHSAWSAKMLPWGLTLAVGVLAASRLWTGNGLHPRDALYFNSFNTVYSAGAIEGFLPNGARSLAGALGAGAGLVGRVPT